MIELAAGRWRAALRPEIGGCLAQLEFAGVPVLRRMDHSADHPLQSACFALVPYCNRIAEGRFQFAGREVQIAENLAPEHHPLHGTGWLRSWRALRNDATNALLEDDYAGEGDWPWPYRAHQHVALDATGCTIRLIVENRAAGNAPVGLGLHPYFRRSADTTVSFTAREMLGINADFLPDGIRHKADTMAPWSTGTKLPERLVDHCFTGWAQSATIADEHGAITVRGFGAQNCHVFAPPGGAEFCLEPVSHTPDALNHAPGEMTVLPPGAAAGIALRIEAQMPR